MPPEKVATKIHINILDIILNAFIIFAMLISKRKKETIVTEA
jgi:hypothetical protein